MNLLFEKLAAVVAILALGAVAVFVTLFVPAVAIACLAAGAVASIVRVRRAER